MTTKYAAALDRELTAAAHQAAAAKTPAEFLAALDRYVGIMQTADKVRRDVRELTRALLAQAMQAHVDPREFYGRPFSSTVVREIAKEAGINFPHRGRRPRTKPTEEGVNP